MDEWIARLAVGRQTTADKIGTTAIVAIKVVLAVCAIVSAVAVGCAVRLNSDGLAVAVDVGPCHTCQ